MQGKKILVTGGAGFIGSHLVRRLVNNGAEVAVIVKYKSVIDNVRLCSFWNDIKIIEADLRNIDSLLSLKSQSYDILFHLAAYNHVGDSFVHVNEALLSNVIATANILENGPDWGRFIYTATSEVYGLQESVPFRESSSLPFPISPYSIGKYAGELYAKMKKHQTGKEIVCLRPFNTFGPYQSERAVIPELIVKCLRGETVKTTQGLQTREFNYVDNIIDGFLAAATVRCSLGDPVNIGSGQEISIRDLIKIIHGMCKSTSELKIGALPDRPTEIWRMSADNKRAKELLGWTPKISFKQGMEKTVAWFRDYLDVYYGGNGLQRL
jgi:UDP-glucose 4-epimerase